LRPLANSLESLVNSEMDIPIPAKPVPTLVVIPRTTRRGTNCTALCSYLSINPSGHGKQGLWRCELKCGGTYKLGCRFQSNSWKTDVAVCPAYPKLSQSEVKAS
jgi:hypothetical protein